MYFTFQWANYDPGEPGYWIGWRTGASPTHIADFYFS